MVKKEDNVLMKNLKAASDAENMRRRAMRKVRKSCFHHNHNGTILLQEDKHEPGLYTCSRCGVSVSLAPIEDTQLIMAADIVSNAIEQTRIASDVNDPDSIAIAEEFASVRMTIENLPEIYRNMSDSFSNKKNRNKKKKNKKRRNTTSRYI